MGKIRSRQYSRLPGHIYVTVNVGTSECNCYRVDVLGTGSRVT
jgi:hypothetical protein